MSYLRLSKQQAITSKIRKLSPICLKYTLKSTPVLVLLFLTLVFDAFYGNKGDVYLQIWLKFLDEFQVM